MAELDDKGFAKNWPLKSEKWMEFFKGSPPGCIISHNSIPPGILIVQNFMGASFCDALVKECDAVIGERHALGKKQDDGTVKPVVNDSRSSEAIFPKDVKTDIIGLVRQAFQTAIEPHYRVKIEWFESPEILRYKAGGQYTTHSDAHNWLADEHKWCRVLDRDLSILLYINNDFEGGKLVFPNCDFSITPSRGMLVAFPSDWRYLHAALPVRSGTRYAIVSWAAANGGPRINPTPPNTAIRV